MARNHPKSFATSAFEELSAVVPRGQFQRFDTKDELPSALSRIAGFPTDDEYRATLVMSNTTTGAPPSIGGLQPASSAPIFRISVIKTDQHGTSDEEHFNQYESLVFKDIDGQPRRLFAADQPGHYQALSTDSSLDAALDLYHLPREKSGQISILQSHGRTVDFSTGGPSSDRSE